LGGIKVKTKEQIPLIAYRCPSCGYVELYAIGT
jgi:predicted nucleic-acid-binding Zn-ribbon protein